MTNKYQVIKKRLKIPRLSLSDEHNTMGYHSNTLLSSDEGSKKAYMPDHKKKVRLVNTKIKFVCHAEGNMNSSYQGDKLGLYISRVSTDYGSNIIGHHRNALLPNESSNKFFKPDIYMAYKPILDINQ